MGLDPGYLLKSFLLYPVYYGYFPNLKNQREYNKIEYKKIRWKLKIFILFKNYNFGFVQLRAGF